MNLTSMELWLSEDEADRKPSGAEMELVEAVARAAHEAHSDRYYPSRGRARFPEDENTREIWMVVAQGAISAMKAAGWTPPKE